MVVVWEMRCSFNTMMTQALVFVVLRLQKNLFFLCFLFFIPPFFSFFLLVKEDFFFVRNNPNGNNNSLGYVRTNQT